jgi:ATP-dependent DNA helicase HFM1/MER3
MQSEMFDAAFGSDASLAVSAPTGAGKTALFDLALCRLQVTAGAVDASGRFVRRLGAPKAVFIAPLRVSGLMQVCSTSAFTSPPHPPCLSTTQALVQERCLEWTARFGPLGLRCVELTGDSGGDGASATHLSDVDIILTTPEKFDAVTRRNKGRDGLSFLADIGLVLLDEVHTLSDDRGPALEAVMSRLKLMGASPQLAASPLSRLRCVGVSATIPNICDLAAWLGGPRCVARAFGEEYRATALEVFVHGYNAAANEFLFERNLKYALFPLVQRYSENQFPVLIFCSSRKGAEEACRQLVEAVPAGAGTRGGPLHPFIATAEAANALADAGAWVSPAAPGARADPKLCHAPQPPPATQRPWAPACVRGWASTAPA